jgi:hypothetical protein
VTSRAAESFIPVNCVAIQANTRGARCNVAVARAGRSYRQLSIQKPEAGLASLICG